MTIEYAAARPENDDVIAYIGHRGLGMAQGPHEKIKYMGAMGLDKNMGVGLVVPVKGQEYPFVAVANIDPHTQIQPAMRRFLEAAQVDHTTRGSFFIVPGKSVERTGMQSEIVLSLNGTGLRHFIDWSRSNSSSLLIDLATGEPVNVSHFSKSNYFGMPPELVATRLQGRNVREKDPTLHHEMDLRNSDPGKDLVYTMNLLNPVRDVPLNL